MNLDNTIAKLSSDIDDVNGWADEQYAKYFAPYFNGQVELYNKMKGTKAQVLDEDLEWILTDLPMELFAVTEQLSKLKTAQEVIKLHIKQTESNYMKTSILESSETKKREAAQELTQEDRLLVTVYDSIIDRVARQMTFSKELIMSAKKIWDARRADGIPLPEMNLNPDKLPEYIK